MADYGIRTINPGRPFATIDQDFISYAVEEGVTYNLLGNPYVTSTLNNLHLGNVEGTFFVRNLSETVVGFRTYIPPESSGLSGVIGSNYGSFDTSSSILATTGVDANYEFLLISKSNTVNELRDTHYGVQVFKSTGELAFSSRLKHGVIAAVISMSWADAISVTPFDFALPTLLPGKRRYFSIPSAPLVATRYIDSHHGWFYFRCLGFSSDNLTLRSRLKANDQGVTSNKDSGLPIKIIILDI